MSGSRRPCFSSGLEVWRRVQLAPLPIKVAAG